MRYLTSFVSLYALLCACAAIGPTPLEENVQELANTSWVLVKPRHLSGNIQFDETVSVVSGYNGCNTFQGEVIQKNYQINFDSFAVTKKFCEEHKNHETEFMTLLSKTKQYNITKKSLTLVGYNEQLLVFNKSETNK